MQQLVAIHTHTGPDGAPVRRVARFRTGFGGQGLTDLGGPGGEAPVPSGATVAATCEAAALRAVAFPFADLKKAAQAAPFEVESLVPFDIDEAVISHEPLDAPAGTSRLLVAVAPGERVAEVIADHGGGDHPQVILPEPYALFAFARRLALPGPALVVDARPGRVLVVALASGRWLGSRRITAGWDPAASPHLPAAAAAALRRAAQSLLIETGERPEAVVLTGTGPEGGPAPETLEAVAKALGLDAVPLEQAVKGLSELAVDRADPAALAEHAVAVGAGLAALDGRRRMNLRAGPFALVRAGEGVPVRRVVGVGIGVLLVLAVAWADGYVRLLGAEGRLEAAKATLEARYRAVFPDAVRVVDPVAQARNHLKALSGRSLLFGGSGITALGVLDAVSRAIPADLTIDVLEFSVEGNRVRLEAEAVSFDAIDQIKARLAALPEFADVRVSDAKASARESRVKFRVSVTLAEAV